MSRPSWTGRRAALVLAQHRPGGSRPSHRTGWPGGWPPPGRWSAGGARAARTGTWPAGPRPRCRSPVPGRGRSGRCLYRRDRYIGSFSSWYSTPPMTCPAVSITSSTLSSSPRSLAATTLAGSGSPHQQATSGSARIAHSTGTSRSSPGRSRTRGPASSGRGRSSPSVVVMGTLAPPGWCLAPRQLCPAVCRPPLTSSPDGMAPGRPGKGAGETVCQGASGRRARSSAGSASAGRAGRG